MIRKHLIYFVPFRVWIMVLMTVVVCLQAGPAQSTEIVHIGFSHSIIGDINENDTMAAVKLWSTKLVLTDDFPVTVQSTVYDDFRKIETALKENMVDLMNLSAAEFFDLQHLLDHEQFIFAIYGGTITVEYLLLARKERGIADIKDLKGGILKISKNAKTALATIWLDVQLAKAGLPATKDFFDKMVPANKISGALLPVFFGKADACLVTRKGFDTMAELNPQISQQLEIVAASKEYIPGFLGFRKNYQSGVRDVVVNNIKNWHQTPAGYQILTMFQMDNLVLNSFDVLEPTMELVKEHRRLLGADMGTSHPGSGVWPKKFSRY